MELDPYLRTLRNQLATAAETGDVEARQAAALLSTTLEPSFRLSLMHALSDFAVEVTAALDDRVVEIALDGLDPRVSVSPATGEAREAPGPDLEEDGETSRVSLRLPAALKHEAETRAADARVSLNTWLVETVRTALRASGSGHRVRGWVRG